MAMAGPALTLVSNPGSSSRRYAVYSGDELRGRLHFERQGDRVVCSLETARQHTPVATNLVTVSQAPTVLADLLKEHALIKPGERLAIIALRIVAPSSFFTLDHQIDDEVVERLRVLATRAPLHISASLAEVEQLGQHFAGVKLVGVSDSAFHSTKLKEAGYYGLPLDDANKLDLKRFGYHGLSVGAVVAELQAHSRLPVRLVVCHLGSGGSVTAVKEGHSLDTTMGYSPLEGLVMSTRSGSVDPAAASTLQAALKLTQSQLEEYLNTKSGLLGLSGRSADIPELLNHEGNDERAALALKLYVYRVQQAIGQMVASMQGVDGLVFTGTVGERSAIMRQRIVAGLGYLGFELDADHNRQLTDPLELTAINLVSSDKPIMVFPSQEERQLVARAAAFIGKN